MFDEQPDGDAHGECVAEIHRLQDELAKMPIDAARYRWLCDELIVWMPPGYNGNQKGRFELYWEQESHDLNAAVDAAMKESNG